MSHYRPKKHNEYKIGIVSKKEYKDLVPHKEYANKTFGFANPKEKIAIIIDTGNKKLNQQHIEHELEELLIAKSLHEVDGIRYGISEDIINQLKAGTYQGDYNFDPQHYNPFGETEDDFYHEIFFQIRQLPGYENLIKPPNPDSGQRYTYFSTPIGQIISTAKEYKNQKGQEDISGLKKVINTIFPEFPEWIKNLKEAQSNASSLFDIAGEPIGMPSGAERMKGDSQTAELLPYAQKAIPTINKYTWDTIYKIRDAVIDVGNKQYEDKIFTDVYLPTPHGKIRGTIGQDIYDPAIGNYKRTPTLDEWYSSGSAITPKVQETKQLIQPEAKKDEFAQYGNVAQSLSNRFFPYQPSKYDWYEPESWFPQVVTALITAGAVGGATGAIGGTAGTAGSGAGTSIGGTGASAGGWAEAIAPYTGMTGSTAASTAAAPWWATAVANASGAGTGFGPLISNTSSTAGTQGGNMASIYNPDGSVNWEAVIQQQSQPATNQNIGIYNSDGSINWGALTGQDPSLGTSGTYNPFGNIYSSGGIPPSGWGSSGSSIWDTMNKLRQLTNQQQGSSQQQGNGGIMEALGNIFQGASGAGTLLPAAMLAYLNQKKFDYPSPSPIEWPSWMEQARQGAMNPQEYDIASQKFQNLANYQPTPSYLQEPAEYGMASQNLQNLMGTNLDQYKLPVNEIMAAQRAQQDLDYQRWLKQVKPSIANQGQLDSTYWANMMGEPLQQQGITSQQTLADLLTQESLQNMQLQQWLPQFRAGITGQQIGLGQQRLAPQQYNVGLQNQLQQWTPEFQSNMANQLSGLGSQRSASGQGWYGQGLGYTTLANTPGQRGFELEYVKQAKAEEAKNQAEQLWSAIMMGNLFPQNPVFNSKWGQSQLGNTGNFGTDGASQSDWQKLLGYGQTGLQTAQMGKGLWDLGSSIYNWF